VIFGFVVNIMMDAFDILNKIFLMGESLY